MTKILSIAASAAFLSGIVWLYSPASPFAHRVRQNATTDVPVKNVTMRDNDISAELNSEVLSLTDSNFVDTVLHSDKPVLVDFYADWCGPCRMMAPVVEEIADSASDQFVVGKLDVDANPAAAAYFKVDSLPTMLIFKNGELVDRMMGVTSQDELMSRLQQFS